MYGSPDDLCCASQDSSSDFLANMSDSDLARDAANVEWHTLRYSPNFIETVDVKSSSSSKAVTAEGAGSSRTNNGLRNVKAKIKAVARLLSSSKSKEVPVGPSISSESLNVGQRSWQANVVPSGSVVGGALRTSRVQASSSFRNCDVPTTQGSAANEREILPAVRTLRDQVDTQHNVCSCSPPPAPPQNPRSSSLNPNSTTAAISKRKHPLDFATDTLATHPERLRTRSETLKPILHPPPRLVSRPLPKPPVHVAADTAAVKTSPSFETFSALNDQPNCFNCGDSSEAGAQNLLQESAQPKIALSNLGNTRGDMSREVQRSASLRRAETVLEVDRLVDELESLATYQSMRGSSKGSGRTSAAGESTATRFADASREAICHWNPAHEQPLPASSRSDDFQGAERFDLLEQAEKCGKWETMHKVNEWRVHVSPPASLLSSKVRSAHSPLPTTGVEEDGTITYVTSVSQSQRPRENKEVNHHAGCESDPDKTPTLRAYRITKQGRTSAHVYKPSSANCTNLAPTLKHKANEPGERTSKEPPTRPQQGTEHIARLSDAQFDRLARAIEGPSVPPRTPIPHELYSPLPHSASTPKPNEEHVRRSSIDATGTTLSVLERNASCHIDTLDSMIRRHPDKMYEVLRKRPGLMLVVLLRERVEDRLSEVYTSPRSKWEGPSSSTSVATERKNGTTLLEESLIDLHFDVEEEKKQERNDDPQPASRCEPDGLVVGSPEALSRGRKVPSLVVTHHTDELIHRSSGAPSPTPVRPGNEHTKSRQQGRCQAAAERFETGAITELGTRTERTLDQIVHRLEQAGELCAMQKTLVSLQDRLMSTNASCSQLRERLSIVSRVGGAGSHGMEGQENADDHCRLR